MYDMGLLKGNRTKSANIVGSTMHPVSYTHLDVYKRQVVNRYSARGFGRAFTNATASSRLS